MPRHSKVFLIDGSAQFHRAYFAIRGLATTRGFPPTRRTGSRRCCASSSRRAPQYVAISFDLAGPTFRHEEYEEYKANRRRMDDDLAVQIPYVRRVCEVFGLPIIDLPGFEADDVIATLARQAVAAGSRWSWSRATRTCSSSSTETSPSSIPAAKEWAPPSSTARMVEEKFGVPPERVVDVLALVGDAVDNVPGVPGIGDKGARDLVKEFGSLEAVLDNARASSGRPTAKASNSTANRRSFQTPRHLADRRARDLRRPGRAPFATRHGCRPRPLHRAGVPGPREGVRTASPAPRAETRLITTPEAAAGWQRNWAARRVSRSPSGDSWSSLKGRSGVSPSRFPAPPPRTCRATTRRCSGKASRTRDVIAAFREVYENTSIAKRSSNAKADRLVLARRGVSLQGVAVDVQIAAYLLSPGRRAQSLDDLSAEYLGERPTHIETGLPEGAARASRLGRPARPRPSSMRLADVLMPRIEADGLQESTRTTSCP